MAWRVANSLVRLRDQLNAAYPNRSKASDGTIGDPNHQAEGSGSDHNPNRAGVVTAFDITHDPEKGVDIAKLSESLANSKDGRIKYLIRNGQIMVPADYGWKWVKYNGSNPHTSHLHVSVYGDYDNTSDWSIGKGEEEMPTTTDIKNIGGELWGIPVDDGTANNLANKSWADAMYYMFDAWPWKNRKEHFGEIARKNDQLAKQIADLEKKLKDNNDSESAKKLKQIKEALGIQ